jgi:Siphovirus Gp157
LKLYDIPAEFSMLETALIENDGELTPELEKQLDDFLRTGKDKLEGGAMVMRGLEMEAEACRAEAERLSERAASIDNNVSRLKKLILYALDGAFGGKVKTALFTIWGQTSGGIMNFDLSPGTELTELPAEFVRIEYSLRKDAMKEALKAGKQLPEQIIVSQLPGTRFLRVK